MKNCYLCGESLDSYSVPDHIIPNALFNKGDPQRPTLDVHHNCNNLKSKDDEWFIRQLQLRSGFNKEAEEEFSRLIYKAKSEKQNAYIIGEKLHNYKLTKGIFNKVTWGLEFKHNDRHLIQFKLDEDSVARFGIYVENLCRGLFMNSVPSSNPSKPELIMRQYADLEMRGKDTDFIESIRNLVDSARGSIVGQYWGRRIVYMGSRVKETQDKGFVFVQFYNQFGILAVFK